MKYHDGSVSSEKEKRWEDTRDEHVKPEKRGVAELGLIHEGKERTLKIPPGLAKKRRFFQFKIAFKEISLGGGLVRHGVEGHAVGYLLNKKGDCKILSLDLNSGTYDEFTDNIYRRGSLVFGLNLDLFQINPAELED